jgi:hypothetical protein
MDFASAASAAEDPALSALFEQMVAAHHQVLSKRGFDPFHGRRLLSLLVGQGLKSAPPQRGLSRPCATALRLAAGRTGGLGRREKAG